MGTMSVRDVLPPSPPTTSHRHPLPISHLSRPATSTPDDSPASLVATSSGNNSRKRVEFSPWTNILEAPSLDKSSNGHVLKTLPKSKDCQTAAKSILKPQDDQQAPTSSDESQEAMTAATMESLVQALGNNDKVTSVDAYQTLAQLIKTYEEVPDDVETRGHIMSLARCIRRDLVQQEQGLTTPVDINLVTQALKVTVILVWSEFFSPLLSEDFKSFITDRSIGVLAEHTAPKVVVVHYMHVLATQNFRSGLFTSGNRTGRLLEALREITNHVQGKGAMTERLLIYQKLIEQAKPIMKVKAGMWVKEVMLGLCSNVKEIRDKAIAVCAKAVANFPASPAISQAARDALGEESKDRSLNANLTQRLDRMIAAKDEALQVPQIWALVMLLCHSNEMRIDNWSHIRDWLRVIQRCFNCSDTNVRVQAFPAWNRFIYIVKPHEATEAMMAMLAKPIAVQIERTGASASSRGSRPAAVSSYCTLLYYAFRPAASHKQYTKSWNEYIVKVATSQFLSKSTANADVCCRVLMALFWKDSTASRIWNEARAHETRAMDPEEVPSIDCKWIRAKAGAIVDMFRLLFKHSAWGPSIQHSDQAFVAKAWRAFLRAVRESSSKEIKPSSETRKALLSVVSFLNEVCKDKTDVSGPCNMSFDRAQLSCRIAISELGHMSLLEVLETNDLWHFPEIVFSEIMDDAMSNLDNNKRGEISEKQATVQADPILPSILQKALGLLSNQIQHHYRSTSGKDTALSMTLNYCAKTILQTPKEYKLSCLVRLQNCLMVVFADDLRRFSAKSADVELITARDHLMVEAISSVGHIPPTQYAALDPLLTALMSSSENCVNLLLKIWRKTNYNGENGQYGKAFLAVIQEMQTKGLVNLPGLESTEKMQFDDGYLEQDALVPDTTNEEDPGIRKSSDIAARELSPLNALPAHTVQKETVEKARTIKSGLRSSSSQQNHPKSPAFETSVLSTTSNVRDLDAPLLNDDYAEAQRRLNIDQAVMFEDLKSSPSRVANRSSRATSVDCEMARKIAASENLPTTPTLAKQTHAINDEDVPSPTPKARHSSLRIEEVDIPSSPPSVMAARNIDLNFGDHGTSLHVDTGTVEIGMTDIELVQAERIDLQFAAHPAQTSSSRVLRSSANVNADTSQEQEHQKDVNMLAGSRIQPEHGSIETEGNQSNLKTLDEDRVGASANSLYAPQQSDGSVTYQQQLCDEQTELHKAASTSARTRKRKHIDYKEMSGRSSRKRQSTGRESAAASSSQAVNENEQQTVHTTGATSDLPESGMDPLSHAGATEQISSIESSGLLASATTGKGRRSQSKRSKRSSGRQVATDIDKGEENEITQTNHGPEYRTDSNSDHAFHTPATVPEQINEDTHPDQPVDLADNTCLKSATEKDTDTMTALKLALISLEHGEMVQDIDLKALDDLCFQIRFKAQEIVQRRERQTNHDDTKMQ